ncbi:DUF6476 family protein [Paracoccus sp. IB05]|uniref:DUF6476 family protein n=1 Tax=Paracoccus sp. IB05 TaxID=2779367 RepID=UPI0018E7038A|nr:DUF6476 family protein [Paracoccus sp. IB05]MBJ2151909.1 hypothetical protein [Paracoccus sp. IB05]
MAQAPKENAEEIALPPSLRFLKALVIVLMLSMIAGVITVTLLLVTRLRAPLSDTPAATAPLPAALLLPAGEVAASVVPGPDWIGVVTGAGRILIFNQDGSLRQEIEVTPAP